MPILWALVSIFLWIVTSFKLIHMLHTFASTFFFFFSSDTSEWTNRKQKQLNSNLYYNNYDAFLDIPQKLRDELVECKKMSFVNQANRIFNIVSILLLAEEIPIEYFIKCFYNIYAFFLIYIFNNSHRKRTWIPNILPGRID